MLAVIRTGGKQYLVSEGAKLMIEKLDAQDGTQVSFDEVLLIGDDKDVKVGTPTVVGAKVAGKILSHGKRDKVWGIKHKAKKRYKMAFGHRQPFTQVEITKITA